MARLQANVYLTIWTDPDYRALTADAQWLYFTMLTHESLNFCGVMDWRPARLAAMSADMTIPRLQQAAWELGQGKFIAVDPETEEALVRSFVRHDGVLKSPNLTKGMVREYGGIASLKLMELVSREVRRACEENPDWKGIANAGPVAKQFPEPIQKGFDWVPEWFQNGSVLDPPKNGEPFEIGSPTSTSTSTSTYVEREDASTEAPTPKKRATRIKADWMPRQETIDTIKAEYPVLDLHYEHQNFVDWWLAKPGAGALKLDWEATWRNWMRKNGKEQATKQHSGYRNQNQIMADERIRAQQQTQAMQGNALNLIEGDKK